jgi:hypothetical protein
MGGTEPQNTGDYYIGIRAGQGESGPFDLKSDAWGYLLARTAADLEEARRDLTWESIVGSFSKAQPS